MKKNLLLLVLLFSSFLLIAAEDNPADLSQLESMQLYEEIASSSVNAKNLVQEATRSIASEPKWSKEDQKWLADFQKIIASED